MRVNGCNCPDDCNCRHPWRTNYCGCRAHDARQLTIDGREVPLAPTVEPAPTYAPEPMFTLPDVMRGQLPMPTETES